MYARHFAVRPPLGRGAAVVRPELRDVLELAEHFAPPVRLVLVTLTGPGTIGGSGNLTVARVLERHEVTLFDEEGPVPSAVRFLTPEESEVWGGYLESLSGLEGTPGGAR